MQKRAALPSSSVWHDYYSRGHLPWDSQRASSQLKHYLGHCTAHLLGRDRLDVITFDESGQLSSSGSNRISNSRAADPNLPSRKAGVGLISGSAGLHVCPDCAAMKPVARAASSALELACGTGASCVHMAAVAFQDGRVIGVDLVAEAVDEARRRAGGAGVQGTCAFLQADVFSLLEDEILGPWGADTAWLRAQQQQQQQLQDQGPQAVQDDASAKQRQTLQPKEQDRDNEREHEQEQGQEREHNQEQERNQNHAQEQEQAMHPSLFSPGNRSARGRDDAQPPFDFVYDCQAFHALRRVDEAAYISLLNHSLVPGGFLMLLTGNANEPECGPAVLTEQELLTAFAPSHWEWMFLLPTRFDTTPVYESSGQALPLAWWGLLRKRGS